MPYRGAVQVRVPSPFSAAWRRNQRLNGSSPAVVGRVGRLAARLTGGPWRRTARPPVGSLGDRTGPAGRDARGPEPP